MKTVKGFAIGLLVGGALMFTATSVAETVKQYLLVDASYPVHVNNQPYVSEDLPILNYEGSTYIPMKAVGDMLGATVSWNDELRRAEIVYDAGPHVGNSAFRNVKVVGSKGNYTVTGEARVFEATMQYAVSDGHRYLLEKSHMLDEGAPAWSAFTLNIYVPENELPANGTLSIELFEYSANDGSVTNLYAVPLERFES